MAIREHFRRALRRSSASSGSASASGEQSSSSANMEKTTTAASSQTSLSSKSSSSLLTRTFTWGSKDKSKDKESQSKRSSKNKKRPVHPSEKPLTAQNLQHQEMLSQFTWTFGASNPDQIEDDGFYGISPCCTRSPSIAGDSDSNISTSGNESDVGSPILNI